MYEIIKLENGLTIALEHIPYLRSVSFGIWVMNGSRNESAEENGLSHFIEHMLFKGTEKRSSKEIADAMDAIGGQMNAYTSKDNTCYYTRVLDENLNEAIEILADMFFNSVFSDEEIDKERNVILEELSMYEDTPDDLVHDRLQSTVFKGDSLGFSILGPSENLKRFKSKDLKDYYRDHYRPENTVVSIAGGFDKIIIVELIRKYFSHFPCSGKPVRPHTKPEFYQGISVKSKNIEQLHVCLSFPGIDVLSDDTFTLTVFNTLFGGGMSSRLFQRVREEKGLVYSIYSYASNFINAGTFSVYAALNAKSCAEAVNIIADEIKNLHSDKISLETIEKTKNQIKSNYILSLESSSSRMGSIGRSQLFHKKILKPEEVIDKINKISQEDIYRVISNIFDFDKLSLSAVGKTGRLNFERILKDVK